MHGSFPTHQKCFQKRQSDNRRLHSRMDRVDQDLGMQEECKPFQKELTSSLQANYNTLGGKQYALARKETRA